MPGSKVSMGSEFMTSPREKSTSKWRPVSSAIRLRSGGERDGEREGCSEFFYRKLRQEGRRWEGDEGKEAVKDTGRREGRKERGREKWTEKRGNEGGRAGGRHGG